VTVGELRKALEGVDDSLPVQVVAEAWVDGDIDTLHATATDARFEKASSGGIFAGPPFDHFSISADGVPEGTCRECGKEGGEHHRFCGEKDEEKTEDEG
jgi:hypothetical protein